MPRSNDILIIRLSALGDVAMTLPVIYSVCRRYPSVNFHLLTRPFFAGIFLNRPDNLHIIEADLKGRHKGMKGLMRLIGELRKYRFSKVADLHNVMRSWVIDSAMRLSGAKVCMVDKKRASRRRTNRKRLQQRSYILRYADVFARLGLDATPDFTSLFDSRPEPPVEIRHPAVGIAPFARYANKTYPAHNVKALIADLTDRGYNVYLFGSKAEAPELEEWSKPYGQCHSLAGRFTIDRELAAIANLDAIVTMDSANQHLAALTGIPVVSVWGSTSPVCGFLSYRQPPENAVYTGIPCQPCTTAGSPSCPLGHTDCLHKLSPTLITDRLTRLLKTKN